MYASLTPEAMSLPTPAFVQTRSFAAILGIDLQKEVHEDMLGNFADYPNQRRWRLDHPDSNIDYRRVPNLMVFFQRKGESLSITGRAGDYKPGDPRHLGSGTQHPAHRHCRRPERALQQALPHRPRHRRGTKDGGRTVQLENHRTLPLLRSHIIEPLNSPAYTPSAQPF